MLYTYRLVRIRSVACALTPPAPWLLLLLTLTLLLLLQDVSDKYRDLVALVARGTQTYGERLAGCAAVDGLLLCRDREKIKDMFPPSEQVGGAPSKGVCEQTQWWVDRSL